MASITNERNPDSGVSTARLRDFLNDCAGSAACEEADRIREAVMLLRGVPAEEGSIADAASVEAMLACGAVESAVLAILRPEVSFMLSRGGSGACLATVVVEDGSQEMISEGATIALALLAAYVSLLVVRSERDDPRIDRMGDPLSARLH